MLNQIQNRVLNELLSKSNSFAHGSQGRGIVLFKSEGNLEEALRAVGFRQEIKKDKFGMYYGHGQWWHAAAELLVCNVPGRQTWTIGTEHGSLTDEQFEPARQRAAA